MKAKEGEDNRESIAITDTWWNKLNEIPYVSCKYYLTNANLCIEHKGKTLFLLKQASKPVPQSRKRMKRSIYGEEAKQEEQPAQGFNSALNRSNPNIIGNKDDMSSSEGLNAPSKIFDPNQNPP